MTLTIVHEAKHLEIIKLYNKNNSQWEETKCFIAEWMHKNQDKKFTYSTLKGIIQKVKEVYPELPWRS